MTDDVLSDLHDGVLTLTFNRPQARNAMTYAMYDAVAEACGRAAGDDAIHALVLTGHATAFAAGTDIALFRDVRTQADALGYENRIEAVLQKLEDCPKPTIAAIGGVCTGGGAVIAAVCDLRFAAADARFGFPIARTLGNCLSVANYARLSELVGAARVREMVLTARLYGAEEARSLGFLHEVQADHAATLAHAQTLAAAMKDHAPLTMATTKEALIRLRRAAIAGVPDHDLIVKAYLSADFREGMDAFLAKRRPVWRGL